MHKETKTNEPNAVRRQKLNKKLLMNNRKVKEHEDKANNKNKQKFTLK